MSATSYNHGQTYFKRGLCTECHAEGNLLLTRCEACLYRQGCALGYDDKCREQTVAVSFWRHYDGTSEIACNRCYTRRARMAAKARGMSVRRRTKKVNKPRGSESSI